MLTSREIDKMIKDFTIQSPFNQSQDGTYHYFDDPLIGYADINDPIFKIMQEAISPDYLMPADWLRIAGDSRQTPKGTVISWVLPINKFVRDSNRKEKSLPSEPWAHARFHGENFNKVLRLHVADFLTKEGFLSISPSDSERWQRLNSEKSGIGSNWSERHAAYAAGLGTFSLNDGLITERGIAHRVGSIITSLELTPTRRNYEGIYDYCLFYNSGKCGVCINRCPAHAISKLGHDKEKCFAYTRNIVMPTVNEGYGVTTPSCGLCQTRVPCEFNIPGKVQPSAGR